VNKLWAWLSGDGISSLGHGLISAGCVVIGWWVAGTFGAGIGYGLAVSFYGRREWGDIRKHWQEETTLTARLKWAGDGWLDWLFPVVLGLVASVLVGAI